ncbi:hypothetical protein [Terricaulis silvestris]|uniref:Uncharacterized protein n=1 Tax=Terricaulis silvestris TaxID=2686094 RepID=A0A6I6MWX3_9CAUL|nr:hypothetical protein [Terricaulis silvestris]QGZ95703.1 hypothetical protein DSM104635_02554 [Terricaulis silvestris]
MPKPTLGHAILLLFAIVGFGSLGIAGVVPPWLYWIPMGLFLCLVAYAAYKQHGGQDD